MKKSLSPMTVSCALLFLLAVAACQRSVTAPVPSLQSKIIGKWTMLSGIVTTASYGITYKDTINFTSADYFDFKADSTLSIMATGVTYNGRWEIDSTRLYITGTNYFDFAGGFDLPVLDQHNLQIHDTYTATPNTTSDQNLIFSR
jgi:hypothetical protein